MWRIVRTWIKKLPYCYVAHKCRREFLRQKFTRFNERAVEYAFVFRQIASLCPRQVLDVGSGESSLPHLIRACGCMVTASDNFGNFWTRPLINRHYHVIDDDILRTRLTGPYDLITCVSVLEHIPEADRAVKNMFRLLAPMGYLILTFPYSEHQYVPNVYELPGATYGKDFPYIAQAFSRADLDRWGRDNGAWVLEQEYWQFWEGEFWTVGRQITPPIPTSPDRPHQHTCILFQNCEPCKEESHQIRD